MKRISLSRCISLLFLGLGFCPYASAQEYLDLASFSYTTSFNSNVLDEDRDTSIQEWSLNVDLPLVLDEETALIFGLGSNKIDVELIPSPQPATELYSINLRLGINRVFSEKWTGTFLLIPKVASDFTSGFRKGNQIGAVALLSFKKHERLKYSYGFYVNKEEFGLLLVPILGVYYKSPNNRFEADVFAPARIDLNFGLGQRTSAGLRFDGLGSSFSIQNPGFQDHYVTRVSNDLYTYAQLAVTRNILLRAKLGYAFFRNFKVYENDDKIGLSLVGIFFGDNREILNQDIRDSFQFKMEMVYRFHFKSNKQQP
ncbi:hypothetical protein SAMN06265375_103317 [Muriicola jejuensis]|uniref:DUF4421 domain-containing protein n=1 Tax=Muriicola jejuensis TaxID=504488 RepID=A0A6P0UE98_9FLAO|nr:DUF6268 family outer membrane beta-barrel protein [Muriicola jejuensis]NER11327.1 hypothetical protein [Muriicola jejuensis]SMP21417.1 hypothetical protein SAMN06265375_103317 [Muriicola jejuensis]